MEHLGNSTPITTVQDEEIVLTGSDGHTFKMKVADLAEAVRKVMPVATSKMDGLMSKSRFSNNEAFSTGMIIYEGDIDQIHTLLNDGLSTVACAIASTNRPYPSDMGGILINVNRIEKYAIKIVYQVYIPSSLSYKTKSRFAINDGGPKFIFSNWI